MNQDRRPEDSKPLLEVSDLHVGYGCVEVVRGIAIRLHAGSVVTIVGANGAGKTTTLLALSGILRSRGGITFDGRSIAGSAPHAIVQRGIVHVPEGRAILAQMTVRENLALGAWRRRDGSAVEGDIEKTYARFPILRERAGVLAGSLSGGEQQMLAIARGLIARPKLLILDEPSMGLAPVLVQQVFQIVASLRAEGLPILLVEQNARQALAVSDFAYVMERGRIAKEGPAKELLGDPAVIAAYLGGG